jgi:tryptophan-rich sensory protein
MTLPFCILEAQDLVYIVVYMLNQRWWQKYRKPKPTTKDINLGIVWNIKIINLKNSLHVQLEWRSMNTDSNISHINMHVFHRDHLANEKAIMGLSYCVNEMD